jgi:hypothetical protein
MQSHFCVSLNQTYEYPYEPDDVKVPNLEFYCYGWNQDPKAPKNADPYSSEFKHCGIFSWLRYVQVNCRLILIVYYCKYLIVFRPNSIYIHEI